ncbi:MAG: endonuclease/exonuclease/phosphatase family protein [Spirochaetales bacterium]|nr:endonuclease/exonuclease/phosphatase family protein [Spirochaetales bacterium]
MTRKQVCRNLGVIGSFLFLFISCTRCSLQPSAGAGDTLTVLSYNCQNIFDDVSNGSEYPEFDPAGGEWNSRLFHTRLQNLSEVLRMACPGGPDIIALQEIENLNVLDILVKEYLKGMGYRWYYCVQAPDSAVNTGVVSRLPVETCRAHRVDDHAPAGRRYLLEVRIETTAGPLLLLNNHWKSKLGGAEETEEDRIRAASLVCRLIREAVMENPCPAVLTMGDLNENPDEYERCGGMYRTALMPAEGPFHRIDEKESVYLVDNPHEARVVGDGVFLYTPWTGSHDGSYAYHSEWEKIDHLLMTEAFFDGGGIEYSSFQVMKEPFLLQEGLWPCGWNSRTASGYSDHLPLILELRL